MDSHSNQLHPNNDSYRGNHTNDRQADDCDRNCIKEVLTNPYQRK